MKKLLLSMILATTACVVMAQTNFRDLTYDEALEVARKEKKMVFVDFYSDWCSPCKQALIDFFPLKQVGDYLNRRFVCLKVNGGKGEGNKLYNRLGGDAYPTLLIHTADGKELMRRRSFGPVEDVLTDIEIHINPEKAPEHLKERYESGERTADIVKTYAYWVQKQANMKDYKDRLEKQRAAYLIAEEYFDGLKENKRLSKENWFMYTLFSGTPSDRLTQFAVAHLEDFPEQVQKEVRANMKGIHMGQLMMYFSGMLPLDKAEYNALQQGMKALGLDKNENCALLARFVEAYADKDWNLYITLCEENFKKLSQVDQFSIVSGLSELLDTDDKNILGRALKCLRTQLPDMSVAMLRQACTTLEKLDNRVMGIRR